MADEQPESSGEKKEGMNRRDALKIGVFTAAGVAAGGALGFLGGSGSRESEIGGLNARLRFAEQRANLPSPLAPEISFYNWTLYTNYAILDSFTSKTGINVIYNETAETQDDFRSRLRLGNPDGFDIMVITGYAVQEAIAGGYLAELKHQYIPNADQIDSGFATPWDSTRRYSLPYLQGTTGIGWGTDLVSFPAGQTTINSWNQLFDTSAGSFLDLNRGHVTIQADRDEALAAAAIYLGKSVNDLSPATLQAVEDALIAVKPFLHADQFADASQYYANLGGAYHASHAWSGDVLFIRELGAPNVTYTVPNEGALLWTDNFVIPANAPHLDTAMLLIDHMWEAANQAVLAMFRNYMVANGLAIRGGPKSQDAYTASGEPFGMILPYVWGLPEFNLPYKDLFGDPPDPRLPLMQALEPRTASQNQDLADLWDRVRLA